MKKILVCVTVLFLALAASVFADAYEIEQAFRAYEAVVIEAERIANQQTTIRIIDYTAIDQRAVEADRRVQAVLDEYDVSIQDTRRLLALNTRFNDAILIILTRLGERGYFLFEGR